jgi:hypothetical protein
MKPIVFVFVLMNILVVLPLKLFYSHQPLLLKTALASIVLFTIVWILAFQLIYIGKLKKMDGIALALGGVIAIKFFGSMIVFLFLFFMGLLSSKLAIGIFLLIYAAYAVLIAVFGRKQIE